MKNFKYLIIIFVFLSLSFITIDLKTYANIILPTSFNRNMPVSYTIKKNKEDIINFDEITINTAKIDDYTIFDPVDEIEFSAKFRINNSFFETTLFKNTDNYNIENWIKNEFTPYLFNEDNFSTEFTEKENKKLTNNIYSATTKLENGYYVNYFRQYGDKVFVLTIQIGYYSDNDIKEIIKSIKVAGENLDQSSGAFENRLHNSENSVKNFNKNKNQQVGILISTRRLVADASSYYLPWTKDNTYMITQDWGANDNPPCNVDTCSHYGLSGYAYDFGSPEGTDILASDAGTVTYIQSAYSACGGSTYRLKANYITISHADGKATNYHHLQSVSVNLGDQISRGQIIGKSGKTGFTAINDNTTCAAHLHFQKQAQGGSYTQSEPIIFAEYPNQPGDGEIPYGTNVTSQNVTPLRYTACNSNSVFIQNQDFYPELSFNCAATTNIYVEPEVHVNSGSDFHLYLN